MLNNLRQKHQRVQHLSKVRTATSVTTSRRCSRSKQLDQTVSAKARELAARITTMSKETSPQQDFRWWPLPSADKAVGQCKSSSEAEKKRYSAHAYTVAWICALPVPEWQASRHMFDEEHQEPKLHSSHQHQYVFGKINGHAVVMGCCPVETIGNEPSAALMSEMISMFKNLQFAVLVGVAGGVWTPEQDIRLGDIVVSKPSRDPPHEVSCNTNFGKKNSDGRPKLMGHINRPGPTLLSGLGKLQSARPVDSYFENYLSTYSTYNAGYDDSQPFERPDSEDVLYTSVFKNNVKAAEQIVKRASRNHTRSMIHYGLIASGNLVMKDASERDEIIKQLGDDVMAFEMEDCWNHEPKAVLSCHPCSPNRISLLVVFRSVQNPANVHEDKSKRKAELLMKRISQYDAATTLLCWSKRRLENTTQWIFQQSMFDAWLKQSEPGVLLLTGKSKYNTNCDSTADSVYSWIWKDNRNNNGASPLDVIRSFIQQVLQTLQQRKKPCSPTTVDLLERAFGDDNIVPDVPALIHSILTPLIRDLQGAILCLDGIDSFDIRSQRELLQNIAIFNSKMVVSCRDRLPLRNQSSQEISTISIDAGDNRQDIGLYIDERFRRLSHVGQILHEASFRKQLKEKLLEKANGIQEELMNMTDYLPEELDKLFRRCLLIKHEGKLLCNPRILKWVAAALLPPNIQQIREMIEFDNAAIKLNRMDIERGGVNLLVVQYDGTLVPIHDVVRQFLFDEKFQKDIRPSGEFSDLAFQALATTREAAILDIAHLSLKLIRHSCVARTSTAFLSYAIRTWTEHTKEASNAHESWHIFEDIALRHDFVQAVHPWETEDDRKHATDNTHLRGLLGYAVAHNHEPLLKLVLQHDLLPREVFDRPLPRSDCLPPLLVAAAAGYQSIVSALLEVCDINKGMPLPGDTALYYALINRHSAVVNLLLEHNIDHTLVPYGQRSTLHLAAEADLQKPSAYDFSGALLVAAIQSRSEILNFLLAQASEATWTEERKQALMDAMLSEHVEVRAAYANMIITGEGDVPSVLGIAVAWGDIQLVQLLIDQGASAGAISNVLAQAAYSGQLKIAQLLIDQGVSAQAVNIAFVAAAERGELEVVQLLIHQGVSAEAIDEALVEAIHRHKLDFQMARLLIDQGASTEAIDNVLVEVAYKGRLETAHVLVDNGASAHGIDKALAKAAFWGRREIAQLLSKGASAEAIDKALVQASCRGELEIARLLIEKGVSAQAISKALREAVESDQSTVAELLKDKSAQQTYAQRSEACELP
ncbi:hypothetical protein MRB53_039362 [Persea americana]|nr:hypothetical protein MRB53_039362 [Persea americana]